VRKTRQYKSIGYANSNWKVNKEAIAICLSGNMDLHEPTEKQYKALVSLIKEIKTGFKVSIH
jgi:hypothetical protein